MSQYFLYMLFVKTSGVFPWDDTMRTLKSHLESWAVSIIYLITTLYLAHQELKDGDNSKFLAYLITLHQTESVWSLCWCFQKAEAQLAYELQAAKEQQKIRLEEIEIEVVHRKKEITIEEKEIDRTDKELIATVKRPAEAEAYKIQQLAEGHKWVRAL